MVKYLIKRVLTVIPVLVGISLLTYMLITMLPGSPIDFMLNSNYTAEDYLELLKEFGFDAPWYEQYWLWLQGILQGEWGTSYQTNQPVLQMIADRMPSTLLLMGVGMALSIIMSIPLGVLCAVKQNSALDYSLSTVSFLGSSFPGFFMAMVIIYFFNVKLGWFPASGMYSSVGDRTVSDLIHHLTLPACTIAFSHMGQMVRYVRGSVLEELGKDYLRTAAAKGVRPSARVMIHALRNSLLSVITLIGMQIPSLFGGSVIIEKIFAWPGVGTLLNSSTTARDYPVLLIMILISAIVVALANLLTDIIYAVVDPRIRLK